MPVEVKVAEALRSSFAAQNIDASLVEAQLAAADEMIDHYVAGRMRPSELSGGDFCEASFRILQQLTARKYTPLHRSLPRMDQMLQALGASTADDSLRIHIPRVLQLMYDVRNRRGVGHLAGSVSANRGDAELLLTCARWVIAELLRLFHTSTHDDAQVLVDRLVQRTLPVIENFDGVPRVITEGKPSLPEKVLVLAYSAEPERLLWDDLTAALRPHSHSSIRKGLARLDERNLLHRSEDGSVRLTSLGARRAEAVMTKIQGGT